MSGLRHALGAHEVTDKKGGLWRSMVCEFLGTLLLNFFGCGAVMTGSILAISFSFGLTVAAVIQVIGHVSGGHVNPAVTFGLLAIGKIPLIRALLYVLAQSVGAITGSAILRALSSEKMELSLGAVELKNGLTPVQGFGVEFFLAFLLVLVVCGACDSGKIESKPLAPLIIGLAVTIGHIVGIPRTSTGMNPARALGAAVIQGDYPNHWLYWIGPILGGVAGALVYSHAVGHAPEPELPRAYNADEKELHRLTTRKGSQPA